MESSDEVYRRMRERREHEDVERKRQMNEDRRHREILAQNERIARASEIPSNLGHGRTDYRPVRRRGGRIGFLFILIIIGAGVWWVTNHPKEMYAIQHELGINESSRNAEATKSADQYNKYIINNDNSTKHAVVRNNKKMYPRCSATITDQCQE